MGRRSALVAGLTLAALGVLLFGLRSAHDAAALERTRHRLAIDNELRAAAGLAATELRTQVRKSREGSTDPGFPVHEFEAPPDEPSSASLARARAFEFGRPEVATDAYLGVILETDAPDEESAARRAIARMLMRDGSVDAALGMLRRATRIEGASPAECERVRQAMAQYDGDGATSGAQPSGSVAEAALRLLAAADPEQLVLTRGADVAWRRGSRIAVASLRDLLNALLPGYAEGRWRMADSATGRALPAPFPRVWLAPSDTYLATGDAPATRLRNAYALPAILGALLLVAAAAAAWVALGRQQRFEQRRSAFLCAVTHELKTPIANIALYGELLRDHGRDDPERIAPFAGVVLQEAERLGQRVQEMLDVASGRRDLPPSDSSFDPVAVVSEVVEEYRSRARERSFEMDLPDSPEGPSERARGAAMLFRRAVDGILANAVRFAPTGTIHVQLHGAWTLLIDDEGPGIAAGERERVFDPFVRLQDAMTSTGTGLGLTLIRQCIDECGGTVAIEASPAGGVRVRVTLEGVA